MNHRLPICNYRLALLLVALAYLPSQAQDILWEKSYGGKHADYLFDVIPTPDYGFILAGSSVSKKTGNKTEDNRGDLDYWVWKMDEKGDLDWQKSLGGSGQDKLKSIVLTNEGGFLLAGSSQSGNASPNPSKGGEKESETPTADFDKKDYCRGQSDYWIIKLNAKGGEEWQKTIGGTGQDELSVVVRTKDGGFVIGGSSSSDKGGEKAVDGFGGLDYWVLKLDKEGKIVWQQTFGGVYNDELRSITATTDGGFLLGGSSNSSGSSVFLGGAGAVADSYTVENRLTYRTVTKTLWYGKVTHNVLNGKITNVTFVKQVKVTEKILTKVEQRVIYDITQKVLITTTNRYNRYIEIINNPVPGAGMNINNW